MWLTRQFLGIWEKIFFQLIKVTDLFYRFMLNLTILPVTLHKGKEYPAVTDTRNKKSEWLAITSTDLSLEDKEIVRIMVCAGG